jgi:hypothetical protein
MLGDCKRNNEIRHKRIDRPAGGTIRFFNQKENEWTEKRFGRSTLAIQRRPPEDLFIKENQEPVPMIHLTAGSIAFFASKATKGRAWLVWTIY